MQMHNAFSLKKNSIKKNFIINKKLMIATIIEKKSADVKG
jgi:hypothetical protein